MNSHPLDYPLMREAQRLRDLADKIDELRSELAPRDVELSSFLNTELSDMGEKPVVGTTRLDLVISDELAEKLRRGEPVTIGGPDTISVTV